MTTYSVRCRHNACRHRQRTKTHPDDMQTVPCPSCGNTKGWRLEARTYNKRGLCHCEGPQLSQEFGKSFPHRTTHPYCDHHPHGFYNQARARGVEHEDIPKEYWPMAWIDVNETRPTDHTKDYLVASNWGVRSATLHGPEWGGGFQDIGEKADEGMFGWDVEKGPFTVTHWQHMPEPPK